MDTLYYNQDKIDPRIHPQPDEDLIYETRVSNCLFSQLMIGEFSASFFATFGLFMSIVLYEQRLSGQE
jgi:hypothetical protein